MERDEAIAIIRKEYLCVDRDCDIEKNCGKCDLVMPSKEPILEAFKMAIKALEQEPCEDAISRKAAIDQTYIFSKDEFLRVTNPFYYLRKRIKSLPSVTPQYTDAEIQKMQELEQAEIEKAYELGKAERPKTGHWKEVYAETDYFNGWIKFSCENCGYQHRLESGEYKWSYGDPIPWKYCPLCGAKMDESEDA